MVSVKTLCVISAFAMCINLIVEARVGFVKIGERKADTEDYEDEIKAMAAADKIRHEERKENVKSILSKEKVDPSRRPSRHEEREVAPLENEKRAAPLVRGLGLTAELTGDLTGRFNGNAGKNSLL